jgi:hypothetical protein
MNFPKRPVPPARRIAKCKRMYDSLKLINVYLIAKLNYSIRFSKTIKQKYEDNILKS